MNILKLTEGIKDTGKGLQGCAVYSRPIIHDIKTHKAELDKEGASQTKKILFLTGFTLLHILERWAEIKPAVMEVKDGALEIIQAIKEPGLPDFEFEKEKQRIDDKQYQQCEALPKRKPEVKQPDKPQPEAPVNIPDPTTVINAEPEPAAEPGKA